MGLGLVKDDGVERNKLCRFHRESTEYNDCPGCENTKLLLTLKDLVNPLAQELLEGKLRAYLADLQHLKASLVKDITDTEKMIAALSDMALPRIDTDQIHKKK